MLVKHGSNYVRVDPCNFQLNNDTNFKSVDSMDLLTSPKIKISLFKVKIRKP